MDLIKLEMWRLVSLVTGNSVNIGSDQSFDHWFTFEGGNSLEVSILVFDVQPNARKLVLFLQLFKFYI